MFAPLAPPQIFDAAATTECISVPLATTPLAMGLPTPGAYPSSWVAGGITGRGGGRGAELRVPPTLLTRKFLLKYQEKRSKEKSENWKEKKENQKGKVENWGRKVTKWGQNEERTFFFFFLFTFQNHWNLFWVYQNGNFLPGKKISRQEKNQEIWLCPVWKIVLLRPWFLLFPSKIW